ncbi:DUF1559 domain-containing protein [Novipirellula rosea]|uniref:DUF1559 domain-containing protein n=1 Tax=Novipirellula rosea TaxID=1031540 RepID=A0ABP8N0K7_9BACT
MHPLSESKKGDDGPDWEFEIQQYERIRRFEANGSMDWIGKIKVMTRLYCLGKLTFQLNPRPRYGLQRFSAPHRSAASSKRPVQNEGTYQTELARCTGFKVRAGLTVLELLVTMSIIGILVALLLPAIGSAREAARRVQCVDHLRQSGMALHQHHNAKAALPAGWQLDAKQETALGWAVQVLPFLEQQSLKDKIDAQPTLLDPGFAEIRSQPLVMMLCPSDITEPTFVLYAGDEHEDEDEHAGGTTHALDGAKLPLTREPEAIVELPTANYVGVFGTLEADDAVPAPLGDGAFLENRPVRFREFQRGLSQTYLVGERTMAQVPSTWLGISLEGEDAAARLVGSALEGINNPLADECDFSSRHPGGANFLYGDGHVRFVDQNIDLTLYHEIARLRR